MNYTACTYASLTSICEYIFPETHSLNNIYLSSRWYPTLNNIIVARHATRLR